VAWLSGFLFFVTPILFVVPPLAARVVLPEVLDSATGEHETAYVAIAARLLPSGLLGMMLAAMFSATMSSLNSEYNVMAGVVTNDIYKRLFRPEASAKHLLWAGRACTILIGLGITFGAMLVGGMGGAFEANKLFTSILAIPLAIPLLFGLLTRRPTSLSLILTISLGASLALLLNFWPEIQKWAAGLSFVGSDSTFAKLPAPNWETATLITIAASTMIFCFTGGLRRVSPARQVSVDRFLEKLRTPIDSASIPSVDPAMRIRLAMLFGGAFSIVGLLYLGVSLASVTEFSGAVGVIAGGLCAAAGCTTCALTRHMNRKKGNIS
jgi:Na+/proline symporter